MLDSIKYSYLIDPDNVSSHSDFTGQPVIGLDTETFFEPETRQNQLSLLQLASPTGRVVVVDALAAVSRLSDLLSSTPPVVMAAHNARFDEEVLGAPALNPRLCRHAETLHGELSPSIHTASPRSLNTSST
jgi:hypothetical protein